MEILQQDKAIIEFEIEEYKTMENQISNNVKSTRKKKIACKKDYDDEKRKELATLE